MTSTALPTTSPGVTDASTAPAAEHDPAESPSAEALAERVFGSVLGGLEALSIYLGDNLGWYRSLASAGPATPEELAERTGTAPRYAQEWLEQQAVAGYLDVELCGTGNRFRLSDAAREVFTDRNSLSYLAPFGRLLGAVGIQLPRLVDAYRTGGGVSWATFGEDMLFAQADMNRPWYEHALPSVLRGQPELHDRLSRSGARIVDVGCGAGYSTVALSTAYPEATLVGMDIDDPSIDVARRAATEAGVSDRVRFSASDAADLAAAGPFDVAFAFECVHDMARPIEVLSAVRAALASDGVMVVMDEAAADVFAPGGDIVERLLYAFSTTICLPDGLSHSPSVGTGTVMRPDTLRRYATEAGFRTVEVLPTGEFGFWRFYQLSK
jgi:2-polyprenyl-3-methyl-5-hydroxy-6-metoxy-1,4-benzoquinol methylase